MKTNIIDLRADTVTRPTAEMRKAMYEAEVGDDVLQEDPTVNRLERVAAEIVGKESALFVPSGTFGNQCAIFSHCLPGNEVILAEQTHVVQHEVGAAAMIAGAQLRTITPTASYPIWSEIDPRIRKRENIHYPDSRLIALENALSNGDVMPLEAMQEIYDRSREYGVAVHLDGARIFNAAEYLGVEASALAACTDTVMFCLSKGLCSPVGSMLAGDRDLMLVARKRRKTMGGGMRQAGVLAAAGIISLEKMRLRVGEDRQKAERLADALRETGVFEMLPESVKINMLFARFKEGSFRGKENRFVEVLKTHDVLTYPREGGWMRLVTHNDVSFEDIERVCSILDCVLEEVRR